MDVDVSFGQFDMNIFADDPIDRNQELVESIFSNGRILDIEEDMAESDTLSIAIRPDHRLTDIDFDSDHDLTILKYESGLIYWFDIKKNGRFRVIGKMIRDGVGKQREYSLRLKKPQGLNKC